MLFLSWEHQKRRLILRKVLRNAVTKNKTNTLDDSDLYNKDLNYAWTKSLFGLLIVTFIIHSRSVNV